MVEPGRDEPTDDLAADLLARTAGTPGQVRRRRSVAGPAAGGNGPGASTTSPSRFNRRPVVEPTFSGPGPDRRDPMSVARAVDELLDSQGWREHTAVASALARWEDIAGPDIAAHVSAQSFDDGVLTLVADSTAWATQLRMLMPHLRARVDQVVGRGVVADIVVQGPTPPRQRGALRVRGRGPRDTHG